MAETDCAFCGGNACSSYSCSVSHDGKHWTALEARDTLDSFVQLREDNERLREALEFYGQEHGVYHMQWLQLMIEDDGKRARAALQEPER